MDIDAGAAVSGRLAESPRPTDLGLLMTTALAATVVAYGAPFGLWYLPFLAGAAIGAAASFRRPGAAATAVALLAVGPLAWGAVLFHAAAGGAVVVGTARTVAALAGLPTLATVTIGLTLAVALLQAAAGALAGRAVVRLSY